MASIVKRGSGWRAQVRRRGYPQQSGTFDSRAEAEAWASVIESEMHRGIFLPTDPAADTTLADVIDRYVNEVLPTKKSQQSPKSALQRISQDLGEYSLINLTPKVIIGYRNQRAKTVAAQTVRHDLSLISRVIDTAIREWEIHLPRGNPVAQVKKPAPPRGRDRRLKRRPNELALLLKHAAEYESQPKNAGEIAAVIEIAVETGMRRGEITQIKKEHIDLKKRVIHLPMTKSGDARDVPLSTRAATVLKGVLQRNKQRDLEAAKKAKATGVESPTPSDLVFRMRPDSITQAFDRICTKAKINDLTFHDLRHEATSRLFEYGLNPMEVAAITGHKGLTMLQRYTHLRAEDLAKRLK